MNPNALRIKFWGTRGSYPVPGTNTSLYGGNTACVEIRLGARLIVIDAGSGLASFGKHVLAAQDSGQDHYPKVYDIFLSHLHHDHIMGLPFFVPAYQRQTRLNIYCGNLQGQSAKQALDAMFVPPLFPLRLEDLPATLNFIGFVAGQTLRLDDGACVATDLLDHPSGATAYRFDYEGHSVCYLSDTRHGETGPEPHLVAFCQGADLVIYDTMFTLHEFEQCRNWGHSTFEAGVALCKAAGAKALAAFHHHPDHDDATILSLETALEHALPGSFYAREGQEIIL